MSSTRHLPDTGTLRGDLVAMIKPHSIEDGERKLQIMAGLSRADRATPELAEAVHAAIIEPRAAVNRLFLRRAIERGEISRRLRYRHPFAGHARDGGVSGC